MAEKTETAKPGTEQEPDFSNVVFEGEEPSDTTTAGDERLGEQEGKTEAERAAETAGESPEDKKARNRRWHEEKKRKRAQDRDELKETRAKIARLEGEMEALKGGVETRVTEVEKRAAVNDVAAINSRLDFLNRAYNNAKAAREKAMTEGNGAEFNRMDESMRQADREWNDLQGRKKAIEAAPPREAEQPRVDSRIQRLGQEFMGDFPDYDPDGDDENSHIVNALDMALTKRLGEAAQRTPEYWDELRDLVRERIPEWDGEQPKPRQQANGTRPRARQTVAGGGGGESSGGGQPYVLSKDRVQALKDSGRWDDPVKRDKAVKAYKAWDRANPQQRSA